jgi:hypothetical protein
MKLAFPDRFGEKGKVKSTYSKPKEGPMQQFNGKRQQDELGEQFVVKMAWGKQQSGLEKQGTNWPQILARNPQHTVCVSGPELGTGDTVQQKQVPQSSLCRHLGVTAEPQIQVSWVVQVNLPFSSNVERVGFDTSWEWQRDEA